MDWSAFRQGMDDARRSGEPGAQLTSDEIKKLGGPDFIGDEPDESGRCRQLGYDHAVRLARSSGSSR